MKLNLLVLRTEFPETLKKQYEFLGMEFTYHKHGNGPFHYASEFNDLVFEIYPFTKSMTLADKNLRIGFGVTNLEQIIMRLKSTDWKILSDVQETEWGTVAIVQDLDGRKVELKDLKNEH